MNCGKRVLYTGEVEAVLQRGMDPETVDSMQATYVIS
jgi:hypothetical protein